MMVSLLVIMSVRSVLVNRGRSLLKEPWTNIDGGFMESGLGFVSMWMALDVALYVRHTFILGSECWRICQTKGAGVVLTYWKMVSMNRWIHK